MSYYFFFPMKSTSFLLNGKGSKLDAKEFVCMRLPWLPNLHNQSRHPTTDFAINNSSFSCTEITKLIFEFPLIVVVFREIQNIAMAFGGEATPPGTFNGLLVKKNEYRPSLLQVSAKASRSQNSPIGVPQNARR
jgi:hypothetical protein